MSVTRSSPTQVQGYTGNYSLNPKYISNSWQQISYGDYHVLGIKTDGTLYAWGLNSVGQLGYNDTISRSIPTQIGTSSWTKISAGTSISMGITSDGLMYTWGTNQFGQLGLSDSITRSSPVQVGTSSWSQISAGGNHMVAIRSDSTLWSWGNNTYGQLGQASYAQFSSPVQVGTSSFIQADAGVNFTTALTSNYDIYNFGDNTFGQLGITSTLSEKKSFAMIAGNDDFSLAIDTTGLLFAWGLNTTGQLGLNDTLYRSSPVQVGFNSWNFVNVNGAGAGAVASAIRSDGTLWGWGIGTAGVIGDSLTINRSSPVQVSGGGSWTQVVGSKTHKIAIKNDGTLWGWGSNASGQLGISLTTNRSSPTQIAGSWTSVSANEGSSYAIDIDNKLYAWGLNSAGALGLGDTVTRSSPVQVGTSSWSQVYATASWTFATTSDSRLHAWGLGTTGQLGYNDTLSRSSPVQISATKFSKVAGYFSTVNTMAIDTLGKLYAWGAKSNKLLSEFSNASYIYSWSQISSGLDHTTAVRSDGRLYAWGKGVQGQLGTNTTIHRSSPTQIGATGGIGEFWLSTAAGSGTTYAIRNDNTLWGWGQGVQNPGVTYILSQDGGVGVRTDNTAYVFGGNNNGELGLNDTVFRSTPVLLPGSWSLINRENYDSGTVGIWYASVGIDTSGNLYTWGSNDSGQLGTGDTINRSSPVQISTGVTFTSAISTFYNVFALRSDGTIWGIGSNTFGQLATGDTINRSSPVQWGTMNNWKSITSTYQGRVLGAFNYNNEHWVCGSNGYGGSVGDNTTIHRSSPVQVPGAWARVICASGGGAVTMSYGIKTDGTLWAWGFGGVGALGQNDNISRSSPVQIPGTWSQIAITGVGTASGIRSDGTLWAWGDNLQGEVGDGSTLRRSSPVQISTSNNWNQVLRITTSGFIASDVTNNLYVWGRNINGYSLGINTGLSVSNPTLATAGAFASFPWTPPSYRSSPVQIGTDSWTLVSTKNDFALGFNTAGQLYAWGNNSSGQLGLNDTIYYSTPTQILGSYTQLSAGGSHSVAISTDGTVWAWGNNADGQLGLADTINRSSPVQITSLPGTYTGVSAGGMHTLALNSAGQIFGFGDNAYYQVGYTSPTGVVPASDARAFIKTNDYSLWLWGRNDIGQLGNNSVISRSSPVQITTIAADSYIQVSTAPDTFNTHTLGIRTNGSLYGWGYNAFGQLGQSDSLNRSSPVQIATGSWLQVAAGLSHSIAIKNDGTLWGWGLNSSGQAGLLSWIQVASGNSHTLVLRSDGQLFGYGLNTSGQLADGTVVSRSSPVQIGSGKVFTKITAGQNVSAGILNDNRLFVWGAGTAGQLGDGTVVNKSSPVAVAGSWVYISASDYMLGYNTSNGLYAWGLNSSGQLGINDTINRSSPVQIGSNDALSALVVSAGQTSAKINNDGTLFTWGNNNIGQLGLNDTINRSNPVQVSGSFMSVSSGYDGHTLAIDSNYNLFAWGLNTSYQLGLVIDNLNRSSPVQIGTDSWASVHAGVSYSMGRTISNTLVGWGSNSFGQIGNSPTVVWSKVVSNNYSTYSLHSDGTLWAWGDNTYGDLGVNDTLFRSSPVQVPGGSFTNVIANGSGAFAIKNDGTLFTWGRNNLGQLGINNTLNRSNPVQILGSYTQISGNLTGGMFAIDSDGKLYGWGTNSTYQLGLGDTINRSSPVQVSADNLSYIQVSAGVSHTLAITNTNGLYVWGSDSVNYGYLGPQTNLFSWSQISAGASHTMAIRSDNLLFGWGLNNAGQLGLNDSLNRSSPTQIGTSSWTLVSAGTSFTYAIRSDSGLFTWGLNTNGQLGLTNINAAGDTVTRSSPVQVGTSSWTFIATGNTIGTGAQTGFGILTTGSLYGWGFNGQGQLGINVTTARSSPVQLTSGGAYTVLAIGAVDAAFFIRADGNLYASGLGTGGQMAQNNTISRSYPTQVAPSFSWTQVNVAGSTVHAIRADGTLWGWGYENTGSIGVSTFLVNRSSPIQIGALTTWTKLAGGAGAPAGHTAAINNVGQLFVWGGNADGQLGISLTTGRSSPVQVAGSFTAVNAGPYSGMAFINNLGQLFTTGSGASGSIGNGLTVSRSSPVQVSAAKSFTIVSGGRDTSDYYTALATDGTLWAWGDNTNGQLGQNDRINRSSPIQIGTDSWSFVTTANGVVHGIRNNLLYAWGNNVTGFIGTGDNITRSSPVQITAGPASWSFLASTGFNSLGISTGGDLYVWGNNANGQLGTGGGSLTTPTLVIGAPTTWSSVSVGASHVLGIRSNNTLYAWGSNTNGELGIGLGSAATAFRSAPAQIGLDNSWSIIDAGSNVSAAIRNDGGLFTWGLNSSGQLGTNDTITRSSPVQLGSDSWVTVAANNTGYLALRYSDKSIWAWGLNSSGQLGLNITTLRSSPTQIGSSSFTLIASGDSNSLAVDINGILYGWGLGNAGQTVFNQTTNRSNPTQLGINYTSSLVSPVQLGTSSWSVVSAGRSTSFAISTDGALFSWGDNSSGILGLNDTLLRSSPSQIGSSSFTTVSTNAVNTMTIRNDGGLFIWGTNAIGQLGTSDTITRSSPVQIGTSSYISIGAGLSYNLAVDSTNKLFAWGLNTNFGQLGLIDIVNRSSPVLVASNNLFYIPTTLNFNNNILPEGAYVTYFSGSNDLVSSTANNNFIFGTNDFTMEAWVYLSSGTTATIFDNRTGTSTLQPVFYISNETTLTYLTLGVARINSSPYSFTGNWTHVAVSRNSGNTRMFINGVQTSSTYVDTHNYIATGIPRLGTGFNSSNGLTGYLSNVRVLNGTGLYTSNFTPSTTQLTDVPNTVLLTLQSDKFIDNSSINNPISITGNPIIYVNSNSWINVSTGTNQTAIIHNDSTLWGFGLNSAGQIGLNETVTRSYPVQVGYPSLYDSRSSPVQIGSTSDWSQVVAGNNYSLALKTDGTLFAWGINTAGTLADGTNAISRSFRQIPGSYTYVTTGLSHVMALEYGTYNVYAWGDNSLGQIGDNSTLSRSSPVQVTGSIGNIFSSINAGISFSVGVDFSNNLYTWGSGANGRLGIGFTTNRSTPTQMKTGVSYAWAGATTGFALTTDNILFGWGENTYGFVGDGTTISKSSPVQLGLLFTTTPIVSSPVQLATYSGKSFSLVSAGGSHSQAVATDYQLFIWGNNTSGQLGDNTTILKSSPTLLASNTLSITQISSGFNNNMLYSAIGLIYADGLNSGGQVGDNTVVNKSSPVQIFAGTMTSPLIPLRLDSVKTSSFIQVQAGQAVTAMLNDYTIWSWGTGTTGQLGTATTVSRSSPTQIGGQTQTYNASPSQIGSSTWSSVSAGYSHAIALDSSLLLYGWGNGIANGQSVSTSSPVQIGSSTWLYINAGNNINSAIDTNYTLYAWGVNTNYNVGIASQAPNTKVSTPTQIAGNASWTNVGGSGGGAQVNSLTIGNAPSAPVIDTPPYQSDALVLVPYTASTSNGNSTIISYTAVSTPGSIVGVAYRSGSGTIAVAGLTPGTTYTFVVYATNVAGNSSNSNSSTPIYYT